MFAFVFFVTILIGVSLIYATRDITFYGGHTDNKKQAAIACHASEWRWPSDMHRYGEGGVRTRMKDVAILGLSLMQRLLRDFKTDHPLISLCAVSHSLSALLIFNIASNYWNDGVGFLAWGFYLTALWSYQIVLFGAHICIAQVFFLATIASLQATQVFGESWSLVWYFLAGASFGLMSFSSAASRKYIPLVLGAFWYSLRFSLDVSWNLSQKKMAPFVSVIVLICLGMYVQYLHRQVAKSKVLDELRGMALWAARFVARFGNERNYHLRAQKLMCIISGVCVILALYVFVTLMVVSTASLLWPHVLFLVGLVGAILFLTFPHVLENLIAYYRHAGGWRYNRFGMYQRYFASIGKPISEGMRGAGFSWVLRFFYRMMPVHSLISGASLSFLLLFAFTANNSIEVLGKAGVIITFGLSPILVGELSHGPQMSRSYYPGLVGLLMCFAYGVFQLDTLLSPFMHHVLWVSLAASLVFSAVWTLWMLITDVFPARLAPARLSRMLQKLDSQQIFTYRTSYNDALIDCQRDDFFQRHHVVHIKSLDEITNGLMIVPGTSSKAFNMESDAKAIECGDFSEDPLLTFLIESGAVERCAIASLKTFGTSQFWGHESEVTSYRDLILREITPKDRLRGRAWILDVAKIHEVFKLSKEGWSKAS